MLSPIWKISARCESSWRCCERSRGARVTRRPQERRKNGVPETDHGTTSAGATSFPPPLAGEGQGGGMQHDTAFQFTPSPPLPRKREREQTELDAPADFMSTTLS